jgi:hypothetical protein
VADDGQQQAHEPPEEVEPEAVTEGDRAWRERVQKTNEQAEGLQPPHDPDAETATDRG